MPAGVRRAAHGRDGEKWRVDNVHVISRREPIRGNYDVGLPPADELLADVEGERSSVQGCAQSTHGQPRLPFAAVPNVEPPAVLDLFVRVRATVDAGGDLLHTIGICNYVIEGAE
jgi:hypothetical protein